MMAGFDKNRFFLKAVQEASRADLPVASRRLLLKGFASAMLTAGWASVLPFGAAWASAPSTTASGKAVVPILVVGAGVGGATFAKYMKMFAPEVEITVLERNPYFTRHYGSSEVLTGAVSMDDLRVDYDGLKARGIRVLEENVVAMDPERREVRTASGSRFAYDFLVVSPGIELLYSEVPGYNVAVAETRIPSGWIAGRQTALLRRQMLDMPENGTFVLAAPPNPYRCPPGPYERAALVYEWTRVHKKNARVIVLDPKDSFVTDETMLIGWNHLYGFVPPEPYRSKLRDYLVEPREGTSLFWRRRADGGAPVAVDPEAMTVTTAAGDVVRADVINIVPPMRAARIALDMGLTDKSGFCPVDRRTFESTVFKGVYVLGDASIADAMPKSGFSANTQAKVTARAIAETLAGRPVPEPAWSNTCYALAGDAWGIFVADTFRIVEGKIARTNTRARYQFFTATDGERRVASRYLRSWIRTITADAFV